MTEQRLIFELVDGARRYYLGFDGRKGRASTGPKSDAVRMPPPVADTVLRQLAALDAREWRLAVDVPGKRARELAA